MTNQDASFTFKDIEVGDTITFWGDPDRGRYKVEGNAVIGGRCGSVGGGSYWSYDFWVVNIGGGNKPTIVMEEDFIKVRKGRTGEVLGVQ